MAPRGDKADARSEEVHGARMKSGFRFWTVQRPLEGQKTRDVSFPWIRPSRSDRQTVLKQRAAPYA